MSYYILFHFQCDLILSMFAYIYIWEGSAEDHVLRLDQASWHLAQDLLEHNSDLKLFLKDRNTDMGNSHTNIVRYPHLTCGTFSAFSHTFFQNAENKLTNRTCFLLPADELKRTKITEITTRQNMQQYNDNGLQLNNICLFL